jgi:hypothetical protein
VTTSEEGTATVMMEGKKVVTVKAQYTRNTRITHSTQTINLHAPTSQHTIHNTHTIHNERERRGGEREGKERRDEKWEGEGDSNIIKTKGGGCEGGGDSEGRQRRDGDSDGGGEEGGGEEDGGGHPQRAFLKKPTPHTFHIPPTGPSPGIPDDNCSSEHIPVPVSMVAVLNRGKRDTATGSDNCEKQKKYKTPD